MILHVWKNSDGLHLARPPKPSTLTEMEFDPDEKCRQCGERVLSITADGSTVCPWCDSSMNRPRILRYQELEIVRLLKKQSDENKMQETPPSQLISNKSTEKDLRDHLDGTGFYGRSVNVLQLELKAIERPGWVQVFDFHIQAKRRDGDWEQLYGLCRTDERDDTFEVQLFDRPDQQREAFRRDTADMITHERETRHWSNVPLMLLFVLTIGLAVAGALISAAAGGDFR